MEERQKGKNEQQTQLNRQHLAEWNDQLAQEMRARMALEEQHKQDHSRSYQEEINVYDRALLEAQQRQAVNELVQQNRHTRVSMLKRHAQENNDLNQLLG